MLAMLGDASRAGSDAVDLHCDAPVGQSPRVSLGYIRKGFRGCRRDGQTGERLACSGSVIDVCRPIGQKGTGRLLASSRSVLCLHVADLYRFRLLIRVYIVTVRCN